jgi:molecular chaperone GrpE
MSETNSNPNAAQDPKTEAAHETDQEMKQESAQEQMTEQDSAAGPDPVIEEWRNKVTYLAAEMENMKKRFVREKADVIRMANEELLKAMIPVFDNLDLGLKAIRDMESKAEGDGARIVANLMKGVEMTLTHFQQTLERAGVQKIESIGKPFDPMLHEAMGQSSEANVEDNHVSAEFQKGFSLHGRVVRPAKVIVNKKPSAN